MDLMLDYFEKEFERIRLLNRLIDILKNEKNFSNWRSRIYRE